MLHHIFHTLLFTFTLFVYSSTQDLRFSSDGTFTILQLTDLHYGEFVDADENNMKIQAELIARVQPDVVVVTGDVVSGYAFHGQPNFFEDAWNKFTQPF